MLQKCWIKERSKRKTSFSAVEFTIFSESTEFQAGQSQDFCQIKRRIKENGSFSLVLHWEDLLIDLAFWLSELATADCHRIKVNKEIMYCLHFLPRRWMKEVILTLFLFLWCWGHLAEKQEIKSQFSPRGEGKSNKLTDTTQSWSWRSLQRSGRRHLLCLYAKLVQCKKE